MDGPPAREAAHQLEELIQAIEDLRRRVAALEQRPLPAELPGGLPRPAVESRPQHQVSSGLLAQLGRMLLGMAGAYLLRAITEAGILHELAGTLMGLVYAGGWLVSSMRTAASHRVALALQGLTASAIAAPLLWEATTRFHAFTPPGAAAALASFIVLGQAVAWKRDHSPVAAITALAGSITAVALITATLDPLPFTFAVLLAAAVIEYGAWRGHALAWRWIAAVAADFCVFLVAYLVRRPHGLPEGYAPIPLPAVLAAQIGLAAIYVASTLSRTLIRRLRICWFEILQAVTVVGFAVATNMRPAVGGAMMAAGAACYWAAFSSRARPLRRNLHAYATFGVTLIIAGSFLVLRDVALALMLSVLALAAAWSGERQQATTLRMHGALYLFAAAAISFEFDRYWMAALAAALVYGVMLGIARKAEPVIQRIPAALAAGLLAASVYAIAFAGLSQAGVDVAVAGMLRTAFISLLAILLGWFGERLQLAELIWVLYPWMIFGAVKLFLEDFRLGRPITLSVSLLVYGGTLIALPRLLRRARAAAV